MAFSSLFSSLKLTILLSDTENPTCLVHASFPSLFCPFLLLLLSILGIYGGHYWVMALYSNFLEAHIALLISRMIYL